MNSEQADMEVSPTTMSGVTLIFFYIYLLRTIYAALRSAIHGRAKSLMTYTLAHSG
ncbi:hypothetical protein B0H12DRAFT_1158497, partial [Mycena haematopus]